MRLRAEVSSCDVSRLASRVEDPKDPLSIFESSSLPAFDVAVGASQVDK